MLRLALHDMASLIQSQNKSVTPIQGFTSKNFIEIGSSVRELPTYDVTDKPTVT